MLKTFIISLVVFVVAYFINHKIWSIFALESKGFEKQMDFWWWYGGKLQSPDPHSWGVWRQGNAVIFYKLYIKETGNAESKKRCFFLCQKKKKKPIIIF